MTIKNLTAGGGASDRLAAALATLGSSNTLATYNVYDRRLGTSDFERTQPGVAIDGKTPNLPDYIEVPSGLDIDFGALLDQSAVCEGGIFGQMCSPDDKAMLECLRLGMNVPSVLTSQGTRVLARDFTQGGRSAAHLYNLLHNIAAARPTVSTFYQAVPTDGTGQNWAVGYADPTSDTLTAGGVILAAQTINASSQPTATITGNGALTPLAHPCVPPWGYKRNVVNVRGSTARPIQLDTRGDIWTCNLPWMWRAESGMDTAIADISQPQQLPTATAEFVRATWAPTTSAGDPLWGTVFLLRSTAVLTDVRFFPLANNSQRVGDIARAVYGNYTRKGQAR